MEGERLWLVLYQLEEPEPLRSCGGAEDNRFKVVLSTLPPSPDYGRGGRRVEV